jgi:acetoin utilization deacetylase AcuC-like enzyme
MKCSYHPDYRAFLPEGHPFPMGKYPLLKQLLLDQNILRPEELIEPSPLARETLELVHTREYLDKLESGSLSAAEVRRLGIPWSAALWRRSRLAAAGTLLAARHALTDGMAGNLAGGTHHAFHDHAEGFCVLNDIAIAIRQLTQEGVIGSAAVIDLDVHQGNGTASIFERDDRVFTFSMHGEKNYPAEKMRSSLDVGIRDGATDQDYLNLLASNLPRVLEASAPDIAFYLAGVDVAAGDRYGKLALTMGGVSARDRYVIEEVRRRRIPLAIVLGGGYAPDSMQTARLHTLVFREALALQRRASGQPASERSDTRMGSSR